MPDRKDERFCRECLSHWLTEKCPQLKQEWEPVKQDPPDYRLRIGSRDYAVEVTRISMPHTSALYSITALTKEVETEAQTRGELSGVYVLLYRPPSASFRFHRREMKQKALAYISATVTQHTASEHPLLDDEGHCILSIRKLAEGKDMVGQVLSPGASRHEGLEFKTTLRRVIERKRDRFRRAGVQGPAVLLLGHDYPPFEVEGYRSCVTELVQQGGLDGWAAVFLAYSREIGDMLFSSPPGFAPEL
jgi:hypothetical protein